MKQKAQLFLSLFILLIISSCSTSNHVASNRIIQKRTLMKGYYVSINTNWIQFNKQKLSHENNYEIAKIKLPKTKTLNTNGFHHKLSTFSENNKQLIKPKEKIVKAKIISNFKKIKTRKNNITKHKNISLKSKFKYQLTQTSKEVIKKRKNNSSDDGIMFIVMIILAFLIPPLAVYLFEGITKRFWIDLVLALIGLGLGAFLFSSLIYLGAILAVIYALLIVLGIDI